jgi:outer membrane immunogenic protein
MSKYLFIASVMAIAVASPAFAASGDEPTHWDGPYVGVNVGYGGSKVLYPASATITNTNTNTMEMTTLAASSNTLTLNGEARQTSSGVLGGGEVGYNFETSGLVFGVEADFAASGIKGETSLTGSASGILAGSASAGIVSSLDYFGTVRARAGVPLADGRFMPYVTGGFAYGRVKTIASGDISGTLSGSSGSLSLAGSKTVESNRTGWTAGAGAEFAITHNIAFRAEYLYTDLGKNTLIDKRFSLGSSPVDVNVRMKTTANIVRVGLTYRFGR